MRTGHALSAAAVAPDDGDRVRVGEGEGEKVEGWSLADDIYATRGPTSSRRIALRPSRKHPSFAQNMNTEHSTTVRDRRDDHDPPTTTMPSEAPRAPTIGYQAQGSASREAELAPGRRYRRERLSFVLNRAYLGHPTEITSPPPATLQLQRRTRSKPLDRAECDAQAADAPTPRPRVPRFAGTLAAVPYASPSTARRFQFQALSIQGRKADQNRVRVGEGEGENVEAVAGSKQRELAFVRRHAHYIATYQSAPHPFPPFDALDASSAADEHPPSLGGLPTASFVLSEGVPS
ncbi:hypothetical protein BJ912DRAFT_1086175 [Pholiota molesta]|nr:hypothetical protein BJ912DRAFT_1086175 [Pholiota molesta]